MKAACAEKNNESAEMPTMRIADTGSPLRFRSFPRSPEVPHRVDSSLRGHAVEWGGLGVHRDRRFRSQGFKAGSKRYTTGLRRKNSMRPRRGSSSPKPEDRNNFNYLKTAGKEV